MSFTILGIDPGKASGALVVLRNARLVDQMRMPVNPRTNRVDSKAFGEFVVRNEPDLIAQEFTHSLPHDGKIQAFEFGRASGIGLVFAEVFGITYCEIAPREWQAHVPGFHGRVPHDARKEMFMRAAKRRWQALDMRYKRDWDRADAAYVALAAGIQHHGWA